MPVVVMQKPKEKQVRKGWRVGTKVKTVQKKGEDISAKRQASRSAHNYLLLREFGVKAPAERAGVFEKVKGWLGSLFGKGKQA